jgi:DNA-directed RNA polymerase subunit RPC12/RpoP
MEEKAVITQCPSCGANTVYDIETGTLKCTHCEFKKFIAVDTERVMKRDLAEGIALSSEGGEEVKVYKCVSCGSRDTAHGRGITNRCGFCGSTNIVLESGGGGLKPDSCVAYLISRTKAEELFKAWLLSKKMAPKAFRNEDIRDSIKQVYFPVFSFSAATESNYSGTMGREVKYTYYADHKPYTGTRTDYSPISGQIWQHYDYCLQPCGAGMDEKQFRALAPFDLMWIKPFKAEYISGTSTEFYSRDLADCYKDFNEQVKIDLKKRIKERHAADTITKLTLTTKFEEVKFNYVLLPIYTAGYTFKGKKYNFFINGISGKIVGKSPKSLWKILWWTVCLGALTGAAAWLAWKLST